MPKKIITDANAFDTYREVIERMHNQGRTLKEIGEQLGVSGTTINNILIADDYEDYREMGRERGRKSYHRRKAINKALADARQQDRQGEVYSFGTSVNVDDIAEAVSSPVSEPEQSLEDKAWELVLANPDNEPLRKLAREISRREER